MSPNEGHHDPLSKSRDRRTSREIARLAPKGCLLIAEGKDAKKDGTDNAAYGLWDESTDKGCTGRVKRITLGTHERV
jgi:hypothetical protein